jgi:hypothetical protein
VLTPLDDLLAHQTPETFDHVATSDRNFFDRYYFNCHTLDGEVFLVFGMGLYPNLDVIDAFVSVVYQHKQYIVRASRLLHRDRLNTAVGPLSVQVIEGLRRLRVRCDPHEPGVAFDLEFEGVTFPLEEPRFFTRTAGRVTNDYIRMTQCGRWRGWLEVAGRRFEVTAERWWGARDHSWGVRPVGEPEPPGARAGHAGRPQFFWMWTPQQYDDCCLYFSAREDAEGHRWHQSATLAYPYNSEWPPEQCEVNHRITLAPGSRRFERVTMQVRSGTETYEVTSEPLAMVYMAGIGYGPPWRHGVYQGPLAVEGDVWDQRDEETAGRYFGLTETLSRFSMSGRTGYGVFEFLCAGPYAPLGLE